MARPTPRRDPLRHMLEQLTTAKLAGIPFEDAWRAARRNCLWPHETAARRIQKAALDVTKDEWEAAYLDEPTAVSALFDTLTRVAEQREPPESPAAQLGDMAQVLVRIGTER